MTICDRCKRDLAGCGCQMAATIASRNAVDEKNLHIDLCDSCLLDLRITVEQWLEADRDVT